MQTIKINGLKCVSHEQSTLLNIINYMGFNKNVIVIDYNGYILNRDFWDTTRLKENDSIEILSIAGGG